MARPAFDDEEEKPLDPAVEKVRRKLVRFVAINLGLLFVALMAVVAALVYKSRTASAAGAQTLARDAVAGRRCRRARSRCRPAPGSSRSRCPATASRSTLELAGGGRAIFLYDIAERAHRRPLRRSSDK